MAFAEDYSEFFDTDDFAVTASYTPAGGAAVSVKGIFDKQYYEVNGGVAHVAANQPNFVCAASDVSGVAYDDAITVNGTSYKIKNYEPDGTGLITLILEEQ